MYSGNNDVLRGLQNFGPRRQNTNSILPDPMGALRGGGGGDTTGGANDFSAMQRWMGGTNDAGAKTQGILPAGLGVGMGALQGYLGMKQYGLAKDTFKQNKKEFGLNYDAQKQQTNRELRERQDWRNRNTDHAQSTDSYMKENRVRDR